MRSMGQNPTEDELLALVFLIFFILSIAVNTIRMGREHASREKKLPMVNFFIFVRDRFYKVQFAHNSDNRSFIWSI